jgi:glucuronosyltransferase
MLLGAGERIFYQSITVENFKRTILKVLENPEYTKNAQKISKRFKDQPETPLDRAIWWIEYILRNPKPDHLQSPTVKLGSFISNGYDVLVFILLTCLLISYLAFKMLSNFLAWVERLFFRTLSKVIKID